MLAGAAGAAWLAAADPATALRMVEQGRAVLWSQLTEIRTDLDELRQQAPALASALNRVRHQLDDDARPAG